MNTCHQNSRRHAGFATVDIIVYVVLLGLLAYMVIPNIPAIKRIAEERAMKAKAIEINSAMSNFRAEQTVRGAIQIWKANYSEDGEKLYPLLVPYIQMPPPTLQQYLTEGYKIQFPPDPRGDVKLTDPDGNVLEYR